MEGWLNLVTCYVPRWFTCPQTVTHPSTNLDSISWPVDHKSDALTTKLYSVYFTYLCFLGGASVQWTSSSGAPACWRHGHLQYSLVASTEWSGFVYPRAGCHRIWQTFPTGWHYIIFSTDFSVCLSSIPIFFSVSVPSLPRFFNVSV